MHQHDICASYTSYTRNLCNLIHVSASTVGLVGRCTGFAEFLIRRLWVHTKPEMFCYLFLIILTKSLVLSMYLIVILQRYDMFWSFSEDLLDLFQTLLDAFRTYNVAYLSVCFVMFCHLLVMHQV